MNYPVKRAFQDKFTKVHYPVGSTYECGDAERVAMLQEMGFLHGEEIVDVVGEKSEDSNTGFKDDIKEESDDLLKHVGGGYYELPNGEKVKGKEKAQEALDELNLATQEGNSETE